VGVERHVWRREVERPGASRQVYTWVSLKSLEADRKKRERDAEKEQERGDEIEMEDVGPGNSSSTT